MYRVYGKAGSHEVKELTFNSFNKASAYLEKILNKRHLDVMEVIEGEGSFRYVCSDYSRITIELQK